MAFGSKRLSLCRRLEETDLSLDMKTAQILATLWDLVRQRVLQMPNQVDPQSWHLDCDNIPCEQKQLRLAGCKVCRKLGIDSGSD